MVILSENEKLTLVVAGASAAFGLLAATIAFLQLRASVRQSRHQATFDHLARVRKLLRDVSGIDPAAARAAALAYYSHLTDELPPSARSYLDLLDEWDLLAVAYRHRLVQRSIVIESLRNTLRSPQSVSREFIEQLKTALANPRVYDDLDYLIQCCLRPTLIEWLTSKREVLRARSQVITATTTASSSSWGHGQEGRDAGVSAAVPASDAETEVNGSGVHTCTELEVGMIDPKRPDPPPLEPLYPPPEPQGETPGFPPSR